MSRVKPAKSPILELQIDPKSLGDSVIKLGVCLRKDVLEILRKKQMTDPHLVVVSISKKEHYCSTKKDPLFEYQIEEMIMRPLKEAMVYLPFHKAGEHIVKAFIVSASDHKYSTLYKWFEDTDWGRNISVGTLTGKIILRNHHLIQRIGDTSKGINVDPNFFAPEPSPTLKKWVNLFFRSENVDECHFRKRALFAFTLQPVLIILSILFRLASTVIAAFLGYRSINYKATVDVINYHILDPIWNVDGIFDSVFITKKGKGFNILGFPFYPIFPVIFLAIHQLANYQLEEGKWTTGLFPSIENTLLGLQHYSYFVGGYFVFVAVIALLGFLIPAIFVVIKAIIQVIMPTPLTTDELLDQDLEEIKFLTCEKRTGIIPSLENVPTANRTFYLRFHDLKNKWCKPYQKT